YGARVDVVADERGVELRGETTAGCFSDGAPMAGVVAAHALETERAPDARGYAKRDPGGLDEQGAAAAEGVEQGGGRVPLCQGQQARRQVFAQRRLALVEAPAALEERLTRGVEVQRGTVFVEELVHPGVGSHSVNIGTCAFAFAQAVTDAVFRPQI